MRRTSRRDHSDEPDNTGPKGSQPKGASSTGRWEFTSSGRLFAMGATESVRRAAYRAADGEMKILPL